MRPTLLIDEADSFAKDNEELRGILNSGHIKAAAHVIRNLKHKPRRFSTWAPKAIAMIGALADSPSAARRQKKFQVRYTVRGLQNINQL